MKKVIKGNLDKLSGITSALGAFVDVCLLIIPFFLPVSLRKIIPNEYYILGFFLTFILAYLMCSCTCNRKYIVHSSGGIGGIIGVCVGWLVFIPLHFFVSFVTFAYRHDIYGEEMVRISTYVHFFVLMFVPLCAALFSYSMCKRAQKKEALKKVATRKWL